MADYTTIEQAIDRGHIWALMNNGRWWQIRRNGQTKLWKSRPNEFRIPFKVGFRGTGYLGHNSQVGLANPSDKPDFVVMSTDPNK